MLVTALVRSAGVTAALGLAVACSAAPPVQIAAPAGKEKPVDPAAPKPAAKYITETLRGKVVWLGEALSRKHGLRLDADAAQSVAALETPDGEFVPLMKEERGRGFWKDARLRDVELELVVRRYKGVPIVQVIRVYRLKEGKKHEVDYWCDVCAIQMFELKQCECCQGPTQLRERVVADKK